MAEKSGMTEARIQQECFIWHWNTRPSERRLLFMTFNNAGNIIIQSQLKGMGLLDGSSDLVYRKPISVPGLVFSVYRMYHLECKQPGSYQQQNQKKFQKKVEEMGDVYLIFHSLAEFQKIIESIDKSLENA